MYFSTFTLIFYVTRVAWFLISINPNSIVFPRRPNRVQSVRKRRKTRGRDQWIWLVNQRITVIESNWGEPLTELYKGEIVGEAVAKLKEQTKRRKINGNELKADERDDKRENERIWIRNGRIRRQMRKLFASWRGTPSQFAYKCNSISNIRN